MAMSDRIIRLLPEGDESVFHRTILMLSCSQAAPLPPSVGLHWGAKGWNLERADSRGTCSVALIPPWLFHCQPASLICSGFFSSHYPRCRTCSFLRLPPCSLVVGTIENIKLSVTFTLYFLRSLLLSRFSRVQLCATPWTVAYQAPPTMGFSRQEYWSGLPLPSPLRSLQTINFPFSHSPLLRRS